MDKREDDDAAVRGCFASSADATGRRTINSETRSDRPLRQCLPPTYCAPRGGCLALAAPIYAGNTSNFINIDIASERARNVRPKGRMSRPARPGIGRIDPDKAYLRFSEAPTVPKPPHSG